MRGAIHDRRIDDLAAAGSLDGIQRGEHPDHHRAVGSAKIGKYPKRPRTESAAIS
ncbi:hypothetical protein ACIBG0_25055 [Nocardia sp. NPDC050630]|uniref:hypothetical protein n=1 Tax=Nocardia sp. NPDC050630 TaxID=3364321 RepID=UPI003788FCC0